MPARPPHSRTFKRQNGMSYIAKSVMTGADSYFPMTLPAGLRTPFLTPDSTHPNLAFWYTPEAFERDSMADGADVSEWKNVANICHQGHADTTSCTAEKRRQENAYSNNLYVESLVQPTTGLKPVYKRGILNGHGVVRFARSDRHGTAGQYLEMITTCTAVACGTSQTTAGFLTDWTNGAGTATNVAFTMFMVVRTHQQRDDANEMGIVRLYPSGASTGFGVYTTEAR